MINVGVIGCGYWGPKLVRNFSRVDGCCMSMVADTNPERLKTIKKDYPNLSVSEDPLSVIRNPGIDAVAIATPVCSHFSLALEAIQNSKHVLIEKPMTKTVSQSQRLIDEAAKKNLALMVDHTFIYTGAVQKIKDIIDSHELGDIYYFDSVRVNLGLFQHDINVVWDLAPHDFSIMQYLIDEKPLSISAVGACHINYTNTPIENIAYITLHFESGMIAHFHVNWMTPVKVRKMLIGGSRRMVVYDDLVSDEKVKIYDKGVSITKPQEIYDTLVRYRIGDVNVPVLSGTEPLLSECRHFIGSIDAAQTPLTDGMKGLEVVKLLAATDQSLLNAGHPVRLH